jgi:hypothetical protein
MIGSFVNAERVRRADDLIDRTERWAREDERGDGVGVGLTCAEPAPAPGCACAERGGRSGCGGALAQGG